MSCFQNHVSSACRSLETSSLETSSSTSAISNEVRGGRRWSASVFDGPSTGRRSRPWVEGGHEDADTQFWEYSWNQEVFNIPSGQEIYRGLKPALTRERPGRDAISKEDGIGTRRVALRIRGGKGTSPRVTGHPCHAQIFWQIYVQ